jgi:hypothetical protein
MGKRFREIERGTPVWRPHPRFQRVSGVVREVHSDGCTIRFGSWVNSAGRVVMWDERLRWHEFDVDFDEAFREESK